MDEFNFFTSFIEFSKLDKIEVRGRFVCPPEYAKST